MLQGHLAAALTVMNGMSISFCRVMLERPLVIALHFDSQRCICFSRVMLQGHPAAALTSLKCYLMLCLQSDAGEVRRRAGQKGPRSNNSPTKGLLTSPGDLFRDVSPLPLVFSMISQREIFIGSRTHCSNEQHHFVRLSERQLPWTGENPEAVCYLCLSDYLVYTFTHSPTHTRGLVPRRV